MSTENAPTWEACKENVLPIKRGRSAKGLSESLQKSSDSASIDKLREKLFEDTIIAAGKTPKELLEAYILYFKWTRDAYPSSAEKALNLLEKCTCELKDELELKNDQRFVKMWIEYADMVRTPGEIFSFMQSNKIGEKVALFWIAWAFVAEKVLNFKLTDQIFQKGMRRQAEPKEVLAKRYQQFQRRLARHYLNNIDTDTDNNDNNVNNNDNGSSNGNNNGGGGGGADAHRNSNNNQVNNNNNENNNENNNNNNRERKVFGGLTAAQSISSVRPTVSTSRSHTVSHGQSRPLPHTQTHPVSTDAATARPTNATFQIFSDSGSGPGSGELLALTENENWRNLDTQANKRKENNVPVSVWTDAALPSTRPTHTTAPASTSSVPLASMVNIFVDQEFKADKKDKSDKSDNNDDNGKSKSEDQNTMSRNETHGGLRLRQHLDGAESATSRIASNPLARHKLSESILIPTTVIPTTVTPTTVIPTTTTTSTITITTIETRAEVKKESNKSENTAKSVIPSAIKIFEDMNSPKLKMASNNERKITKTVIPSFSIFQENEIVSVKKDEKRDENRDERIEVRREERREVKQDDKKDETALKKGDRLQKNDEKFSEKVESLQKMVRHTSELDELLTEMGILDSEDGTINTRLARRDIDQMFCSPSSVNMSRDNNKNNKNNMNNRNNMNNGNDDNNDNNDNYGDYNEKKQYNSFNIYDPSKSKGTKKYLKEGNDYNNDNDDNHRDTNGNHHNNDNNNRYTHSNNFMSGENHTYNTLGFSTGDLSAIRENASEEYSIFGQLSSPPGNFLSFRTTTKKSEKMKNKNFTSENNENGNNRNNGNLNFEIYNDNNDNKNENKKSETSGFLIYSDNNENQTKNEKNSNKYNNKNDHSNDDDNSRNDFDRICYKNTVGGRNSYPDSGSLYLSPASSNSNHSEPDKSYN